MDQVSRDPRVPPTAAVLAGRGLVCALVLGFLASGMVLRQGLHRGELAGVSLHFLPRWKMFSGVGLGLSQVRFLREGPDGRLREVDPYAVLGLSRRDQPPGVWRVQGRDEARRLGHRLCRALGPGTVLRLRMRTARADGWRRERTRGEDLCAAGTP